jgi:hypothetical protein
MKHFPKTLLAILAAAVISLGGIYVPYQVEAAAEQKLVPGDLAAGDRFGNAVAIDGDIAIVGAQGTADSMGAVYIFTRSGGTWSQQAKLTPADGAAGDYFGNCVAISGETVAVGAYGNDAKRGAVYVFVRNGSAWSQQAKLTAGDAETSDQFGGCVAVDGDTVITGTALRADYTGAAYVFTRSGGTWSQQAKLVALDAAAGDRFGNAAAISGNTAVVGAYTKAGSAIKDAGAAYVFTRSGDTWSQQAKLTGSDSAAFDVFGVCVALNTETVFVGAKDNDSSRGAVYTFTQSGGVWSQQAKLLASPSNPNTYFGRSIAVDGDTLAVSRAFGAGITYLFTRSAGSWSQRVALGGSDALTGDWYASAVDISGDTLLAGAHAKDGKGAVYFYTSLLPPVVASAAAAPGPQATTLSASLSSMGSATSVSVSFEYGPSVEYGSTTPTQPMTTAGTFSAVISGLAPNTMYYFRVKADGGIAGLFYSPRVSFTTTQGTTPVTTATGTTSATSTPPPTGTTATTTTGQTTTSATGTTTTPVTTGTTTTTTPPPDDGGGFPWWLIIGVGAGLIAGVIYYIYRKSRG